MLLVSAASLGGAQTRTFYDGTFRLSDWIQFDQSSNSNSYHVVTQEPDGGNSGTFPDPFSRVLTVANDGIAITAHLNPRWIINPNKTPITSIDFSIDVREYGSHFWANSLELAALQDGVLYHAPVADLWGRKLQWTRVERTRTRQEFIGNGQANLNFSGGGPIMLGFYNAAISWDDGNYVDFDNLKLVVHTALRKAPPAGG